MIRREPRRREPRWRRTRGPHQAPDRTGERLPGARDPASPSRYRKSIALAGGVRQGTGRARAQAAERTAPKGARHLDAATLGGLGNGADGGRASDRGCWLRSGARGLRPGLFATARAWFSPPVSTTHRAALRVRIRVRWHPSRSGALRPRPRRQRRRPALALRLAAGRSPPVGWARARPFPTVSRATRRGATGRHRWLVRSRLSLVEDCHPP